jgi:mRNA interferase RelE/StbE
MDSIAQPVKIAASRVAKYSLELKRSAQKELDNLEDALFGRIDTKILSLEGNPRPSGCVKLAGYKDHWRIRVGQYRVIYIIDDQQKTISITRVQHRKDVYEP